VRFWDASAVVPLAITEAASGLVRRWIGEDEDVALWALTRVEVASTIERQARERRLSSVQRMAALGWVGEFADAAQEVTDLMAVRAKSLSLLARYPIRAADAAQLAAALVVADPDPTALTMVVLDQRLADAASREGLRVLTAA
jgi:predicted nucleic acid-binding protein